MNAFRKAAVYVCLAIAAVAYADPPQKTPGGGVNCDPGCGGMRCTGNICTVCNPEGCVQISNRPV